MCRPRRERRRDGRCTSAARARSSIAEALPIDFQWLRTPDADRVFSLRARKGHLRLFGRETIGSLFTQALVARRQQAHCFSAVTAIDFEPDHFQQMAGLVCYYNSAKFHYLYLSCDTTGKHLRVMSALPDQVMADAFTPPVSIPSGVQIELRVEVDFERLRFAWRVESGSWQWLPQVFDASILSDEATAPGPAQLHRGVRRHGVPGPCRYRQAR